MYSYNFNVNLRARLTDSPHGRQGNNFLELVGSADGQLFDYDGTDRLYGASGNDMHYGGAGVNATVGDCTQNLIDGGEGTDIILTHFAPGIAGRQGPDDSKAIGLSSVTRKQRSCYKKNSGLRNRYVGYRSICCVRKEIYSGCMPSLASSLSRAARIEVADFLLANLPAGVGLSSLQVNAAAHVAANAISTYGASNVTFAGHSLGGGLASIMGVWFDRPATVFDPASFEATARNPLAVLSARNWISLTTGLSNPALNSFEVLGNFTQRESAVTSYYASEEALQLLRMFLHTVTGTESRVEFGVDNMLNRRIDLHSQALLTAGLMSESFRMSTIAVQRSIPLMMDGNLYAYDAASSNQRNFLIDLIRSEQGTGDKLTHFAADLNKLGTNIAGLNKQAQDAIIAQSIEWYYWQGSDYAGQEFFTQTGELLQYSIAKGDGLAGALNKADLYTRPWIQAIAAEHGMGNAAFPAFGTAYDQWNVAAGSSGVTATARNADKGQIFLGQGGADTFTGGSKDDVIFAGTGTDTLDGQGGNDKLYGGAGFDTDQFTSAFGKDLVVDADGQDQIQIDGQSLGTAKASGKRNVWVAEVVAGQYVGLSVYDDQSSSTGKTPVITRAGSADNTTTVKNFNLSAAAKAGETIAPALSDLGDKFKAIMGDSGTRQQRSCFEKHSELRNGYGGYRSIYCIGRSILPGRIRSLSSALPRATGNEALQ